MREKEFWGRHTLIFECLKFRVFTKISTPRKLPRIRYHLDVNKFSMILFLSFTYYLCYLYFMHLSINIYFVFKDPSRFSDSSPQTKRNVSWVYEKSKSSVTVSTYLPQSVLDTLEQINTS